MNSSTSGKGSKNVVPIFVISWAVFFIIGTIGHWQVGNSLTESLYKSLQLFHLHYHPLPGNPEAPGPESIVPIPWTIEIARFGAGLWALTLLPSLVGLLFEERLRIWWVRRVWRNHYVICGECSRTRSLVKDLKTNKKLKVVLISSCHPEKNSLPAGIVFIEGDSADPAMLQKAAIHRAAHLIALHEDDRLNIETLATANELCKNRPRGMVSLEAGAHISDIHLQSGLHRIITTHGGAVFERIKENLFNYYELIARCFARNFPLPPALIMNKPDPVHIIIVGFGAFGQHVALKTIRMAQQLYYVEENGIKTWKVCNPVVTIIDPLGEAAVKPFLQSFPDIEKFCTLNIRQMSSTEEKFLNLDFIDGKNKDAKTVLVFCLENESVTMSALSTILNLSHTSGDKLNQIYIRIAQPERLGGLLEKLQPFHKRPEIVFFANDREIFNADVLLNLSLDIMANAFHEAWLSVEVKDCRANNLPPAAGKKWEELSDNDRQSNREAADHTWAKLRLMGYRITEAPEKNPESLIEQQVLDDLESKEEELARLEHYRWMTWRVLDGWQYGPDRDNVRMLHPDIIEYEELAESTKEKDRVNIRAICDLIRKGSLYIIRSI